MEAVSESSISIRPPPFIAISLTSHGCECELGATGIIPESLQRQSKILDPASPSLPLPMKNLCPLQSGDPPLHCSVIRQDPNLLLQPSLLLYWYINFSECREM